MAIYSPADIAKLLNVKEATVRKYSLLLEEVGYSFKRNANGQRWYEDKDVIALQKLVTFKHNGEMKLKDAAKAVFYWSKGEVVTDSLPAIHNESDRDTGDITDDAPQTIAAIAELLEAQERRYMQALQDMQRQQRERDNLLLETIKELKQQVQEQQKQLNGPATEEPKVKVSESQSQQQRAKKKSFFSRLFK